MITAALVAGLTALILTLLAAPLVLAIEAERAERFTWRWRARGLFGMLDVRSDGRAHGRAAAPDARPPASARRGHGVGTLRRRARITLAVLRTRGFGRWLLRAVRALARRVTVHELRLRAAFGFDNPADTGIAFGSCLPILLLAQARGLDVGIQPSFDDATLRGALSASVRLRPLAVLGVLLMLVLSPPFVRATAAAWKARA